MAATRLFRLLPPLDVVDPEAFITATVVLFTQYPAAVLAEAVDAIACRTDRPTLKIIKAVCDEIYEPILRRIERERAEAQHFHALPPPREPRTPEQQARIDAQVADARRKLGAPIKKYTQGPPISWGDGKHAERVKADLEARARRRETTQQVCGND